MRMKNRSKKKINHHVHTRICEWEGCEQEGAYPAPKSPQQLNVRQHFCLEHVRHYNKSWNYFDGMSEDEGSTFRDGSVTGHRPTWRMGINGRTRQVSEEDILNALFETFGDSRYHTKEIEPSRPRLPKKEQEALLLLELDSRASRDEIKQRYKKLAKQYHPDIGGKATEDRFKAVVDAYHVLRTSEWFI